MFIVLLVNIVDLSLRDFAPAGGALFVLGHLVHDIAAELIFLDNALHEPIPVKAHQVEPVKALLHADQVRSTRELLIMIIVLVEVLQADSATSAYSIVVFGQNLPDLLMRLINKPAIILVLLLLIRDLLDSTNLSFVKSPYSSAMRLLISSF